MQEPNEENIEKVREIFCEAMKRSKPIDDVESHKLLRPLLYAAFHENGDQKKRQNERVDAVFDVFENNLTVKKFIESHQLIRIERLFPLRTILLEHYERHRTDMGYESIFSLAKQKCDFPITDDLFKHFLHRMGHEIQRIGSCNFVAESHQQRLDRLKFIREIQKHRKENKNIIYFQEKTIDFSRWHMQDGANYEVHSSFMVLIVANSTGILNHRFAPSMDQNEFTTYFSRFMALQPPNSIVVFDAKPYNEVFKRNISRVADTIPPRDKILRYLNVDKNELKETGKEQTIQLIDKVWKQTNRNIENDLMKIMKDFKLESLRIPANHPELNPISSIDFYDALSTVPADLLDEQVFKHLINQRLDTIDKDEWTQFLENAKNNEEKYYNFEKICDNDVIDVDLNIDDDSDVEIITEVQDIIQIDED